MAKLSHNDLMTIFPGRSVKLPTGNPERPEIEVTVLPMAVRHLRSFSEGLTRILQVAFAAIGDVGSADQDAKIRAALPVLIPVAVKEMVPIIAECCLGVDLLDDRCPAEWFPAVAGVWVESSFGSVEQIRPWKALLEQVERQAAALRSSDSSQTSPPTDTPSAT